MSSNWKELSTRWEEYMKIFILCENMKLSTDSAVDIQFLLMDRNSSIQFSNSTSTWKQKKYLSK